MNVRDATPADTQTMLGFVEASFDELWKRPFPRPTLGPEELEGKIALVVEDDGEPIGCAYGQLHDNGVAHLNLVYVVPERRREGVAKLLLAEFTARARSEAEHMTLDVDTTNEIGRTAWQRLGFTEWASRMSAPIDSLESRLAGAVQGGESYASIHVQTDDTEEVEGAVAKYLPRFGNSARTTVSPPRNGWVTVYDELCDRDRKVRERLSSELSNATAAVVCTLAVEDGRLVRYVLYERGSVVDEYQSVPEYYGPVVPGDAVALGSNPTVVARLTGAEPAQVRAVARTAGSPEELPPAPELLAAIAEAFGLQGAGRG